MRYAIHLSRAYIHVVLFWRIAETFKTGYDLDAHVHVHIYVLHTPTGTQTIYVRVFSAPEACVALRRINFVLYIPIPFEAARGAGSAGLSRLLFLPCVWLCAFCEDF